MTILIKHSQFIRFLVVGGINTLFGYGVYACMVLIGVHYAFASLFGLLLGVLFNFFTTGGFVFRSVDFSRINRFVGVYGVSYFLNIALLSILVNINFTELLAGAILIIPMALFNYKMLKIFVFS